MTTANFCLLYASGSPEQNGTGFSEIENPCLTDALLMQAPSYTKAGLLLHAKGFAESRLISANTGKPNRASIPLGGIAVKRDLPQETKQALDRIMKRSVAYALQNPESSKDFVTSHAQEMQPEVMKKHIGLYVNHYTESLDTKGMEAIHFMYRLAADNGLIAEMPEDIFV